VDEWINNDRLLELTQKALENWKRAERAYEQNRNIPFLRVRNRHRMESAKRIYCTLLKEVKRRGLSLSSRQLLERILLPPAESTFRFYR